MKHPATPPASVLARSGAGESGPPRCDTLSEVLRAVRLKLGLGPRHVTPPRLTQGPCGVHPSPARQRPSPKRP
jgi:hypothetical protein